MRKLLTLIALSFAMAIGGGLSISAANASPLTSVVHSLKVKQTSVLEKAYYYHRHYRRVARRHYRRAYYYHGGVYHRHYRRAYRRAYWW